MKKQQKEKLRYISPNTSLDTLKRRSNFRIEQSQIV